jgi:hypothetical protein
MFDSSMDCASCATIDAIASGTYPYAMAAGNACSAAGGQSILGLRTPHA